MALATAAAAAAAAAANGSAGRHNGVLLYRSRWSCFEWATHCGFVGLAWRGTGKQHMVWCIRSQEECSIIPIMNASLAMALLPPVGKPVAIRHPILAVGSIGPFHGIGSFQFLYHFEVLLVWHFHSRMQNIPARRFLQLYECSTAYFSTPLGNHAHMSHLVVSAVTGTGGHGRGLKDYNCQKSLNLNEYITWSASLCVGFSGIFIRHRLI
jgi:hypothetical protein